MIVIEQIMVFFECWDCQQEGYICQCEECYEVMFQLFEDFFGCDGCFIVIDVVCGLGFFGWCLFECFLVVWVVVLDVDVMLLEIVCMVLVGFVEWVCVVECDFIDLGWIEWVVEVCEFFVGEWFVVLFFFIVLYWLLFVEFVGFYVQVGELFVFGGVLLNVDYMCYD